MIDALAGKSILDIFLDNALDLFEIIAKKSIYVTIWKGNFEKNRRDSQHSCSYIICNPVGSTNKEVGQTNLECEHGAPISTSLRGCGGRSYNCKLSFSLHACLLA